jgi:hypothetical protein
MRLSKKRQQMMFAHRMKNDVFHEHHLIVFVFKNGVLDQRLRVNVITFGQVLPDSATRSGVFLSPSRFGSSPICFRNSLISFCMLNLALLPCGEGGMRGHVSPLPHRLPSRERENSFPSIVAAVSMRHRTPHD